MKYIRTKDGVYEIKGANLITKSFTIYKGKRQCFIREKDIIKQANTIEELCDEFVVFAKKEPNGKLIYLLGFENLKREIVDFETSKKYLIIYGAIWTDKGLIYVAKMNDKGELELC